MLELARRRVDGRSSRDEYEGTLSNSPRIAELGLVGIVGAVMLHGESVTVLGSLQIDQRLFNPVDRAYDDSTSLGARLSSHHALQGRCLSPSGKKEWVRRTSSETRVASTAQHGDGRGERREARPPGMGRVTTTTAAAFTRARSAEPPLLSHNAASDDDERLQKPPWRCNQRISS